MNASSPESSITVSYLNVAQRWEISVTGLAGTTVLTDRGYGLWAGKGSGDQIVELVIDQQKISSAGRDLIARAFGAHIAEVMEQMDPEDDLDLVIARNLPAERSPSTSIAFQGEPGVPFRSDDADSESIRYVIAPGLDTPGLNSSGPVVSADVETFDHRQIWLTVNRGTLRIQLPNSARGQGLWVRISSAQSGSLLGLAVVRDASPPIAELTMNLEVRPEDLHVAITPTPLVPVGDHRDRLRRWAEQLLSTRSDTDAATAKQIAEYLHDQDLLARAQWSATAPKAPNGFPRNFAGRWWAIGAALVLLSATLIGIGFWAANAIGGSSVTGDGLPGPMTASYSDGATLRAFIPDTLPEARPGDEIPLTITATTPELIGYGFDPATTPAGQEEQRAREACRSTTNRHGFNDAGSLIAQRSVTVRLRSVAESGVPLGSVIAASATLPEQVVKFSSVPEACDTASFELNGAYLVPSIVERAPTTIVIRLPASLPAGLWAVSIDAPDQPVSVTGEILIRVRDR